MLFILGISCLLLSLLELNNICVIDNATIIFVENVTLFVLQIFLHLQDKPNAYRPISFFVRLSQRTILNINSIVKFDEVSVNEGNHFNSGDGIFVAPVSGTYQFSLTTLISSSQIAETELKVDNVIKETLHISWELGLSLEQKWCYVKWRKVTISGSKPVMCMLQILSLLQMQMPKVHLLECWFTNCRCLLWW